MSDEFDRAYWERHWNAENATTRSRRVPVNPYLPAETSHLRRGTALDAGCGTGSEALWLAEQGWHVTGADISTAALDAAARRADATGLAAQVEWVRADLTSWKPGRTWDLVVTSYAHPAIGQLAFYRKAASWVAPGGTLLIVGHLPGRPPHGTDGEHGTDSGRGMDNCVHGIDARGGRPAHVAASLPSILELFTTAHGGGWRVEAAYESTRTVTAAIARGPAEVAGVELADVVVRVHRV